MSKVKDPNAELDFQFNWSAWLLADETIASHTVTVPAGLTLGTHTVSGGRVTVWLSGGTAGQSYPVTCRITTNQGRTDDRTMRIDVRDR